MSKYEDYDSASHNYDKQRFAMGADVIAAMMQFYCGKPLKEMHVLDAGCGTGNYAKALIDYGVGHVTLFDASKGMLDKAKEKLADEIAAGTVKEVVQATMPPLPFPDASFDAVMFNLVFHHLATEGDGQFPKCVEVLKDAVRTLRHRGVIVLSSVMPSIITHALWYVQLNTALLERFLKIMPTKEQFHEMFEASNIKCVQKFNILGSDLIHDYYNFEGPLDEKWRAAISYWSFATKEELDDVERKVRELKQNGQLEQWCTERDRVNDCGFLTVFICTRS